MFEPPFGRLRGNVRTLSIARWKALLDFLFAIIEFVRCLLRLRRHKRKSVEVGVFRRGWVTSRLKFRLKGYFSRQYLWLYYNFAAGSFHTKKLCSRLYSTEVHFYLLLFPFWT